MDQKRKNYFISGFIVIGISLSLFALTIYYAVDANRFIAGSVETDGVIQDYVESESTDSKGRSLTDYYPVIKYFDSNGSSHSFRSNTTMNYEVSIFKEAKESDFKSKLFKAPKVKVRYLTANPDEVRAARTFFDLWGNVVVLAIISVSIAFVGGALIWFDIEKKRGELKRVSFE